MIDQNFQIIGLDESVLRRVAEEIVRMADHILIERRRGGDHHSTGAAIAASCAPGTLPSSGDRTGIASHHYYVEAAHVDAEFQRAARHHAANAAVTQAALDFAALVRQIAAAIAANRFLLAR